MIFICVFFFLTTVVFYQLFQMERREKKTFQRLINNHLQSKVKERLEQLEKIRLKKKNKKYGIVTWRTPGNEMEEHAEV